MAERVIGVHPALLKWARERSGYDILDVAERLDKTPSVIQAWESDGPDAPTYVQLEKMADLYKRPIAVFFFPVPPTEEDMRATFRTIPD